MAASWISGSVSSTKRKSWPLVMGVSRQRKPMGTSLTVRMRLLPRWLEVTSVRRRRPLSLHWKRRQ